jgi:hypothetical protein
LTHADPTGMMILSATTEGRGALFFQVFRTELIVSYRV